MRPMGSGAELGQLAESLVAAICRGKGWRGTFYFHALEEEMATHSSVLAWRIPGMADQTGTGKLSTAPQAPGLSEVPSYTHMKLALPPLWPFGV